MNEKSKSTVTSYRLNEETKEKLKQQLKDLDLTQEEYFNRVVALMELENTKQNNLFSVDATELQRLTQRLYDMFINLAEQGNSFLSNKDAELEEVKEKYKNILHDKENILQEQKLELQNVYSNLDMLQNENTKHEKELLDIKIESSKQIDQLQESLQDKSNLIEEYKSKNDTLVSIVEEYKQYKLEVEQLKTDLEEVRKQNTIYATTIATDGEKIEKLTNTIDELKSKHTEEVQANKDRLNFECDRRGLELQKKQQEQIQEMQESYNSKVRELLEELEQARKENRQNKLEVTTDIKQD